MYKIGFIGSGKMAGAIIKGLIKTSFAKPEELIATQAETEGIDCMDKYDTEKLFYDVIKSTTEKACALGK